MRMIIICIRVQTLYIAFRGILFIISKRPIGAIMATFNKLAIATVLAAASATATADTLLISYSGDADVYIPDAYAELYSVLEGDPALATSNGEIIVPDFQD